MRCGARPPRSDTSPTAFMKGSSWPSASADTLPANASMAATNKSDTHEHHPECRVTLPGPSGEGHTISCKKAYTCTRSQTHTDGIPRTFQNLAGQPAHCSCKRLVVAVHEHKVRHAAHAVLGHLRCPPTHACACVQPWDGHVWTTRTPTVYPAGMLHVLKLKACDGPAATHGP